MEITDEEKTNTGRIQSGDCRFGSWRKNSDDSESSFSRSSSPDELCKGHRLNKSLYLPSDRSSLECPQGKESPEWVRTSDCGIAGTEGVHCEEMVEANSRTAQEIGKRSMKTIVSANQKGGVGKTSTIVHLAFDFAERGKKVVFIDADPQQNATWTLIQYHCGIASSELFNEETPHFTALPAAGISLIAANDLLADIEKKNLSEAAQNFARSIEALGEFYDVCLIDTPPTLGVGLTSALVSADFVFSPIMLESYSLQGIGKLLTTISNVKQFNPSMIFLGMLPNLVDMRNPRHKANLAELEVAYPDLLMPAQIGLRSSIAEAVATKLPVWKIKKTAARVASKEVKKFTQFVFDKAEIG